MNSILADLFNGKVMPYENLVPKDVEFTAMKKQVMDERAYFNGKLSKDDIIRFDRMEEASDTISDMENVESFSRGFRLAAMIFIELLYDKNDLPDVRKLLCIDKTDT